ncbi:MAG: hypothetical protein OXB96_03115 [Candidatus Kaiserbacteria bacterium]|nr:hypothetical protein [Candidatus Kaiserbacteria bacterium]
MTSQKIKSVFIFIVLVGVLFYFGHLFARESQATSPVDDLSSRFLAVVAVLDSIQFDFAFLNSLGSSAVRTDVYIQPLSSSGVGRDNPFMRSGPSTPFRGSQEVPTGVEGLVDPGATPEGGTTPSLSPTPQQTVGAVSPASSPPVQQEDQLTSPDILFQTPQENQSTSPETSVPASQDDQSTSPPTPSSATLTR